jgi:hypothetical protein
MWVLVWLQMMNGQIEHFQIGTYQTQAQCNSAKEKAKVLVMSSNHAVYCFEVSRN